jgi:dTDP-4-amino-4,6-dideoxygalactose transaminase
LNSFEGGAVCTNDDQLAERMRFMRNFGFAGVDDVDFIGTNGKMTEVCAAMGLTLLESLDEIIAINRRNYLAYRRVLAPLEGIQLYTYDESERCNYQYVIVEVDETKTGISRDALVKVLQAENVLARRYFYPGAHQMEPYRSYFPHARLLLPETERLVQRVMSLPTGTAVSVQDIEKIGAIIEAAIAQRAEILEVLGCSVD